MGSNNSYNFARRRNSVLNPRTFSFIKEVGQLIIVLQYTTFLQKSFCVLHKLLWDRETWEVFWCTIFERLTVIEVCSSAHHLHLLYDVLVFSPSDPYNCTEPHLSGCPEYIKISDRPIPMWRSLSCMIDVNFEAIKGLVGLIFEYPQVVCLTSQKI